jgi:hypothetical protein
VSASGSADGSVSLANGLQGQWLLLVLFVLLGIGLLAAWWIVRVSRRNRQKDSISISH